MLLSELDPGEGFAVLRVLSGGEIGKRLADMGFTEGAEGEFVRGAFLRGPLQVTIRGYALLIRRGEARLIEITRRQSGAKAGAGAATAGNTAGAAADTDKNTSAGESASAPWSWRKSPARRFLVSLFTEPDCCSGSKNRSRRGGR